MRDVPLLGRALQITQFCLCHWQHGGIPLRAPNGGQGTRCKASELAQTARAASYQLAQAVRRQV
jgi:hypothetical protein